MRNLAFAPALASALLLAACSSGSGDHAAAATSSSAGLPQGNIAAGEQLANAKGAATGQSCVDCHGPDGNAPIDPSYPKLGGQFADYLGHALQGYRSGARDHALMSAQAKALTDQQIADLSVYFASREGELVDLSGMDD
ncbi:c-type cytochrome [Novilysobacter arseniciresistens]|uniref:c-type cytochrome n=1 Tax=Novilysobacter arseniciresistens TaxID=1385522 RepID=UPI003CCE3119